MNCRSRIHKTIGLALLLCSVASCYPVRYASWKPSKGAEAAWTIKAALSPAGFVTVTINETEVTTGQVPMFGSREFDAEYRGHAVKMALTRELGKTQEGTNRRCTVMIDGEVAGQFAW